MQLDSSPVPSLGMRLVGLTVLFVLAHDCADHTILLGFIKVYGCATSTRPHNEWSGNERITVTRRRILRDVNA